MTLPIEFGNATSQTIWIFAVPYCFCSTFLPFSRQLASQEKLIGNFQSRSLEPRFLYKGASMGSFGHKQKSKSTNNDNKQLKYQQHCC